MKRRTFYPAVLMRERRICYENISRGSTLEKEAERLKEVTDMTDYTKAVLVFELAMHNDGMSFAPARDFIVAMQEKINRYGLSFMIIPPTDKEMHSLFKSPGRALSRRWEEQGHTHVEIGMDMLERIYAIHDQITE